MSENLPEVPDHRDAARRRAAEELAALLAQPEGLRLFRLLQAVDPAGTTRPAPGPALAPAPAPDRPGTEPDIDTDDDRSAPIGIWQPVKQGGRTIFARAAEPESSSDLWAPARTLEPKTAILPLRICLLGESAAAGMFYRPEVTPSRILQAQLGALKGPEMFEVVDLTKISTDLVELMELAVDAMQLRPDILVVFAGNNWAHRVMPVANLEAQQHYAGILGERGILGLMAHCAERLRTQARGALGDLAAIAEAREIPVIVVVPEVNLRDWGRRRPVPWLAGDGTPRWYDLLDLARRSLDGGDAEAAVRAAREMLALDQGSCATTYRLLAQAYEAQGRIDEAFDACRQEVEASSWEAYFAGVPQTTSGVRQELVEGAGPRGLACVDLAPVFRRHCGGIPGRRMFLDYCHLTPEGMKVAMAAVTEAVLRALVGADRAPTWFELLPRLPEVVVPPQVEANARFMAALYTAHIDLPLDPKSSTTAYWCQQAVEAWSGMPKVMEDFLLARSARCPAVLSGAHRRIQESPHPLDLHVWAWPNIDADVTEAILGTLARDGQSRAQIEERLIGPPRGQSDRRIDLTHPYYGERPVENFCANMRFDELFTDRSVYRAPGPVSSFAVGLEASDDVVLDLTVRLPSVANPREGPVGIAVNGALVGAIHVGERWTRSTVRVDRQHLRRGINRFSLRWPRLPAEGDAALRMARERMMQGLTGDLFPVFGEVFELVVST